MQTIFFGSWDTLFRVMISTVVVYVCIVVFLKISGKRSTSQLNNFDWVVTVMLGSIGASTILLENVPLIEGLSSTLLLLLLQYFVTKYSSVSPEFSQMILSDPKIVFYRGQFLLDTMKKERLTRQELECTMRSAGINNYSDVEAIVFESDAKLTVIPMSKNTSETDDSEMINSETIKLLL